MAAKKPFGRRPLSQRLPVVSRVAAVNKAAPSVRSAVAVASSGPLAPAAMGDDLPIAAIVAGHDQELREWQRARGFHLHWRQISLTASLSFGVASLVLPQYVNEAVQWPLYALAAASFYVWVSGPRSSPLRATPPPASEGPASEGGLTARGFARRQS